MGEGLADLGHSLRRAEIRETRRRMASRPEPRPNSKSARAERSSSSTRCGGARRSASSAAANTKCGKSLLAVAAGVPCLRRFPADEAGPVLLFAAEDAGHIVRARLQGTASGPVRDPRHRRHRRAGAAPRPSRGPPASGRDGRAHPAPAHRPVFRASRTVRFGTDAEAPVRAAERPAGARTSAGAHEHSGPGTAVTARSHSTIALSVAGRTTRQSIWPRSSWSARSSPSSSCSSVTRSPMVESMIVSTEKLTMNV